MFAGVASAENTTATSWKKQLDESAAALSKAEYARSLKLTDDLIADMIEGLGPGNEATEFFGLALMHKALAEAGLGRHDDALWDWHTVLTLYPKFQNQRLEGYGAAGQFLMDNKVLRITSQSKPPVDRTPTNIKPPRLKKRVMPRYPRGAEYFGSGGMLVAEVIITPEGRVTSPMLVKSLPAPTLSYVALKAVRQWKFEPGELDGKKVPVVFQLTMNFKP